MSEVSCRACVPIVEGVRAKGLPPEALVEGLPFSVEDLVQPGNRIPWDDFTVVLERAAGLLGGVEPLEELARGYVGEMGIVGALAANFVTARPTYRIGAKWYGPSLFSATRATSEDLPDGRMRQTVEILPPYRDSEAFFRVVRAHLCAVPSVLGQPNAEVEMELHPRRAVYTITLPRTMTFWRRLRAWYARKSPVGKAIEELLAQTAEVRASYQSARAANDRLADKSHRLETLNRLGHELARHIELGGLADAVTELLEDEFRFDGVALSLMRPEGGEPEVIRRAGETSGSPRRRHVLKMAGRVVGRLDLWEPEAPDGPHDHDLLQELLPWLALALDNVRSFESLSLQTRRLEVEIAGRRRAEERLERVQRMEALGNLASGLAHDFNNLLTAIITHAELARDSVGEGDPARRDLDEIIGATDRGAGLIKQIMTFSRRQMLVPRRLDMNSTILGMGSMLRRLIAENIELVILPAEDLGLVTVDPAQIEQAIVNLVVNSQDAMPEGGRITIETSNVGDGDSGPDPAGCRFVRVEVRDTGVGMDRETRSRAFEPFFTTKARGGGTGLGLSTLHGAITQSGGTVSIESEPGKGTSVSIQLPRLVGEAETDGAAEAEKEPPGGRETLLLVEDDEQVRAGIRRVLEAKGYSVLEAPDGREALAVCESHAGPIELLITDLVMPEMDGRELARRLEPLRSELRGIVYISGYASAEMGDDAPLPPGQVFLAKPFTRPSLLKTVRQILDA